MKKLIAGLLILTMLTSCDSESGSGHVINQQRNTGEFTKISVSAGINVELRKGPRSVKVEADDNLMKFIETEVEGKTLRIGIRDNTNLQDTHITVYVTAPEIDDINASSAADVDVKDELKSNGKISLTASSSGSINTKLDAPEVNAESSSAGSISISGRTKNFSATSSSGASVKASELLSENTTAEASSGADIDTYASVSMDGNASSGADISYRGAATVFKKQESSGGTVRKED